MKSDLRLRLNCLDCLARFLPDSASVWNRGQGRKPFSRSFLSPFQMRTAKGQPPGQTKKRKISMKLQNLIHILMGIVCIGLLPYAQAVVPPPDGGYPGGNTAEGQSALLNLTTGGFNTAVGFFSLRSNIDSSFNTAIGNSALATNTEGGFNTATGDLALFENTTGNDNTANGESTLGNNTEGN